MNLQHQCIPLCSHFPQEVRSLNECLFQQRDVTFCLLYVGNVPLVGCSLLANLWHTLLLFSFSLLYFTSAKSLSVCDPGYGSGGRYCQ